MANLMLVYGSMLLVTMLILVVFLHFDKRLNKINRLVSYNIARKDSLDRVNNAVLELYEVLRSEIEQSAELVLKVDYPDYTSYQIYDYKIDTSWYGYGSGLSGSFVKVVEGQNVEFSDISPIEVIKRARDIERIKSSISKKKRSK